MTRYLVVSASVKRYVKEPGSREVIGLTATADALSHRSGISSVGQAAQTLSRNAPSLAVTRNYGIASSSLQAR